MAMKHYQGPLLPQVPGTDAPLDALSAPPAAPPPAANAAPLPEASSPVPSFRTVQADRWAVAVSMHEISVMGEGDTIEEAFATARAEWDRLWVLAQEQDATVLPLMWADGTPIEGLERLMLIEALDEYAGQGNTAEVLEMVAKFKRALGAEE
jgi:hypothetical protein